MIIKGNVHALLNITVKRNNAFFIVRCNNMQWQINKFKQKTSINIEKLFSDILQQFKTWNIKTLTIKTNTTIIIKHVIIKLFFKNLKKHNIRLKQLNLDSNEAHNGCRLKKKKIKQYTLH
jgi:hypothetical protein